MESMERDPGVRKAKPGEGSLTRRVRRMGVPPEDRMYGTTWRLPRSLCSGILVMIVFVMFFAGLSGNAPRFLLFLSVAIAVVWFGVWALAKTPIRPTFDQRWRPRWRIEPLDLAPWRVAAAELGVRLRVRGGRPRLRGGRDGVAFVVAYERTGGARTVAGAVLPKPVRGEIRAFPRRAEIHTKEDRSTGDPEFDREWRVTGPDEETVRRLFGPEARTRILAAAPEEIRAKGGKVVLRKTGYTTDARRLVELARAAVAMASPGNGEIVRRRRSPDE